MDNKLRNAKQDKYEVKSLTIYAGNAYEVDVEIREGKINGTENRIKGVE